MNQENLEVCPPLSGQMTFGRPLLTMYDPLQIKIVKGKVPCVVVFPSKIYAKNAGKNIYTGPLPRQIFNDEIMFILDLFVGLRTVKYPSR